jgi:hypothetical protein
LRQRSILEVGKQRTIHVREIGQELEQADRDIAQEERAETDRLQRMGELVIDDGLATVLFEALVFVVPGDAHRSVVELAADHCRAGDEGNCDDKTRPDRRAQGSIIEVQQRTGRGERCGDAARADCRELRQRHRTGHGSHGEIDIQRLSR